MDIEKSLISIKERSKQVMNLCRQIGPWIICCSDELSKLKTRHDLRTVGVDLLKKEMELEVETIAKLRESKLKQFHSSSPEDRILIRRDLDDLGKEGRRF